MSIPANYSRDEYVYLAKIYEKAGKFPEMVKAINKVIEIDPKLSKEERNILSEGYKNIISDKRASWRLLNSMEKKEDKNNKGQGAYARQAKEGLENELMTTCEEFQKLIDKYLLPNASDIEAKIFYLKLKGDYYRYKCEFSTGKDLEETTAKAEKAYKEAYELANKELPITSSTRLSLVLNYSVFYYEIKSQKQEAYNIANAELEQSYKVLNDLEKSKDKDTLLIIQLIKENLILWSNEMEEEK